MKIAAECTQHVAHWFSVGVVGNTNCGSNGSGRIHIGLGIGQGKVTQTLISPSPQFYYDVFANGSCTQTIYGFTVPQNVAIAAQLIMTSYTSTDTKWSGSFWANGQWNYVFTDKSLHEPIPNYVMVGSEMGSSNGVFTNIHVPINFQHKVELYSHNAWWPWQVNSMPNPLNLPANSFSQADAPWRRLDGGNSDYTSIAVRAN